MGRFQQAVQLAGIDRAGLEVADLGCGSGRLVDALFESALAPSRVHAIDHASGLDDHLLTDPRVRSVTADLDEPLGLPTAGLDRVFSVNALEHLVDPVAHVREIHRVLRPGGLAVLVHSDWDTALFAGADDTLTRRLVDNFVAAMPTWVRRADGFMGRRLLRLPRLAAAQGAPFAQVEVSTWADTHRRFDDDSLAHKVAMGMAMAGAAEPGLCGSVAGWLDALEQACEAGEFLFSVTDVALVLRR